MSHYLNHISNKLNHFSAHFLTCFLALLLTLAGWWKVCTVCAVDIAGNLIIIVTVNVLKMHITPICNGRVELLQNLSIYHLATTEVPCGIQVTLVGNQWLTSPLMHESFSLGGPNGNSGSGKAMLDCTTLNRTRQHGGLAKRDLTVRTMFQCHGDMRKT